MATLAYTFRFCYDNCRNLKEGRFMQCPYFTVLGYGAFDSAAFATNKRIRNGRLICAYEFV